MRYLRYIPLMLSTLLFTAPLMAQGDEAMPPRDGGMWQTVIMIAIAMVFGYFIVWRPEQKRRKQAEELRNSMKKGDRVTAMGIVGTISRVLENTVIVRMVDGSKIEFLKAAISDVAPATEEELKKLEKED